MIGGTRGARGILRGRTWPGLGARCGVRYVACNESRPGDDVDRDTRFIDEHGAPVEPRVEAALLQMRGKLRRHFPACRDELTAAEVFEEAARRLARRERRDGRIDNLPAYAWVTLRSVMTSRLRRGDARLEARIVRSGRVDALLASRLATRHTAGEVERSVLLGEVLAALTADERTVCGMKAEGFSASEIAHAMGRSPASIDTLYSRAKARARRLTSRRPGDCVGQKLKTGPG
jgi:RNA polymerase sigma factor (sigma-70 family)